MPTLPSYFVLMPPIGGCPTFAMPDPYFGESAGAMIAHSFMKLETDLVGSTSVIFSGVNAGSEIRVYLPDVSEVAGIESCVSDQQLSWPVYAPGSQNNTVRIVIIHPDYKIKEFAYMASIGNQSIPVQQERDKWYSNPA